MKKLMIIVLVIVLLVMVAPAIASTSSNVQIEVMLPPPWVGPPFPFVASGPAVDAGLICPSGMAFDDNPNPIFKKGGLIWHSWRWFECDDGSGTFTLRMMSNIVFDPYSNNGNWNVLYGTENYVNLHGAGKLTAFWSAEGLTDLFTGAVHID